MHHYFEAITNNKGDALTGYYVRLVDSGGAGVTLYADTSLTPIISVSGVADAAKVDADGNVDFYVAVGTYTLNIYATDSTTPVKSIPNVGMNIDADTAAAAVAAQTAAAASAALAVGYATTASAEAAASASSAASALASAAGLDPSTYSIVTPQMFGALGDGVTNDGAAFVAAIAALKAAALPGFGYGPGAGKLTIPKGHYYLGTTTLDIYATMILSGENVGENGGVSTILRWADGVTGIRVQDGLTSGASGTRTADGYTGAGTIIERLFLQGAFAGTESESHGIHARSRITVRDCFINTFSGDGIYGYVSAGSGGATEGNANNTYVERVTCSGNRNGIFWQGADANAGTFIMVDALYNRRWGIWDNAFLANGHFGHHTSGNGVTNVGGSVPYTQVSYSGRVYSVVQGQAAGASTNAPSGTTADNAYWYYGRSGAPTAVIPAWSNGISVRDGGPYFTSTCAFYSCYSETDQGVSQVAGSGGRFYHSKGLLSGIKGSGLYELWNAGGCVGLSLNGGYRVAGDNPGFTGPAAVEFYMYGGVGFMQAYNRDSSAFVPLAVNASSIAFQISGVQVAAYSAAGLSVSAAIKSSAATSGIGYATGAGGAVTQATSKATGVTLNKVCGQITMNGAALASAAKVSFVVTNSVVAATDVIIPSVASGGTANAYRAAVTAVAAGSFTITVENITGGSLSEAPVISFAIIKAVNA